MTVTVIEQTFFRLKVHKGLDYISSIAFNLIRISNRIPCFYAHFRVSESEQSFFNWITLHLMFLQPRAGLLMLSHHECGLNYWRFEKSHSSVLNELWQFNGLDGVCIFYIVPLLLTIFRPPEALFTKLYRKKSLEGRQFGMKTVGGDMWRRLFK